MVVKASMKYGLGAVAVLAAALGVIVYGLQSRSTPAVRERVAIEPSTTLTPQESSGMSARTETDALLVEVDGAIQRVRLPSGQKEAGQDYEEMSPTQLSGALYEGLNPESSAPDVPVVWFQKRVGKLLYGHEVTADGRDIAPVVVCDTEQYRCDRTGESENRGAAAIVPQGAVSMTGQHIALVSQHDRPFTETGAYWELLTYTADQLSKPTWSIDISSAIDRSPGAGYDSVSSVAWSPDEERVAIASSRNIVIADIRSGTVTSIFDAPAQIDEDANPAWDNSVLVWSSSGRYIAFASYSDMAGANEDSDEEAADTLTIIDLEAHNALTSLVLGENVRLIDRE